MLDSYAFGPVPDGEQVFTRPRFSPDGRWSRRSPGRTSASPVDPQWPVRLLSADTLDPVTPQPVLPQLDRSALHSLAFSADGRYLAAGVQLTQTTAEGCPNIPSAWSGTSGQLDQQPRRVLLPGGARRSRSSALTAAPSTAEWPVDRVRRGHRQAKWQRPDAVRQLGIDITDQRRSAGLHTNRPGPERRAGDDSGRRAHRQDGEGAARSRPTRPAAWPSPPTADCWPRLRRRRGHRLGRRHRNATRTHQDLRGDPGPSPSARTHGRCTPAATRASCASTTWPGNGSSCVDSAGSRSPIRPCLASDNGQRTAYLWREGKTSWVSIADAATGAAQRLPGSASNC